MKSSLCFLTRNLRHQFETFTLVTHSFCYTATHAARFQVPDGYSAEEDQRRPQQQPPRFVAAPPAALVAAPELLSTTSMTPSTPSTPSPSSWSGKAGFAAGLPRWRPSFPRRASPPLWPNIIRGPGPQRELHRVHPWSDPASRGPYRFLKNKLIEMYNLGDFTRAELLRALSTAAGDMHPSELMAKLWH